RSFLTTILLSSLNVGATHADNSSSVRSGGAAKKEGTGECYISGQNDYVGPNRVVYFGSKAIRHNTGPDARTVLVGLVELWSGSADANGSEILPPLRRTHDRVIGHFHVGPRGFYHWKAWLSKAPFDHSYFERFFMQAALQCDAVILTSQSLIENDVH